MTSGGRGWQRWQRPRHDGRSWRREYGRDREIFREQESDHRKISASSGGSMIWYGTEDKLLNEIARVTRKANDHWWRNPKTGRKVKRNRGEQIALMHSELSEALEGYRKNLKDVH